MSMPFETTGRLLEPHLFKFRLRQLFLVVTLASCLCALIATTTGPWPWVIGLTAIMVGAHVLGNLIGTRLRDTSSEVIRWRAADPKQDSDQPRTTPASEIPMVAVAAENNLRNFGGLVAGMRWYLLGGMAAGLLVAGSLLAITIGYRISWAGWAVGSLSGGVFGVWIAFMGVSFTTIARDALRQAHRN